MTDFSIVATIGGYKSHFTQDGRLTLCGRAVSNSTSGHDMCKTCTNRAEKIKDHNDRTAYAARAAETQDDVMHAAPAVGAPANAVTMAMPELTPVPLILRRTPIAVVGDTPGGPNHLYGTSKGDGTGPTVDDIMRRAERQGATNLRAYASDTCPEITGHYDTFRPVCVNHPNAEGAWWGKVNNLPAYFCEACNNTPLTERPECMDRETRLRADVDAFNALMGARRTDSRGYVYVVDKVKFSPTTRRHCATVSVSGRVVEEYSDPADGTDRARTHGAYAAELFYDVPAELSAPVEPTPAPTCAKRYETVTGTVATCQATPAAGHTLCTYHGGTPVQPTAETFDYAAAALHSAESEAIDRAACEMDEEDEFSSDDTHGTKHEWSDETHCGRVVKAIRGVKRADRATVDPSDVTCKGCQEENAILAELDARVPDEEGMFTAWCEAELNAAHTPADLPLTLSLTPTANGRLMARVGAYEKPFLDNPTAKMQAAFWARQHGARGNGKAGRFDWRRAGHGTMVAPAHFG